MVGKHQGVQRTTRRSPKPLGSGPPLRGGHTVRESDGVGAWLGAWEAGKPVRVQACMCTDGLVEAGCGPGEDRGLGDTLREVPEMFSVRVRQGR